MIGIFWNCRGAGKKGMSTCLTDLINANEVDFIGLQETMKSSYTPSFFRKLDPHQRFMWDWNRSRGKSGGILLGVNRDKFDIIEVKHGRYTLQVNLFDKSKSCSWALLVVYGAAQDENKPEFIAEMSSMCHKISVPYIVGGDLTSFVTVERRTKEPLYLISLMSLTQLYTCWG